MQNPRGHNCILVWQNWTNILEEFAVDRSEFFRNVCTLLPTTHYHNPEDGELLVTVMRT
jgi:hypothetical protein